MKQEGMSLSVREPQGGQGEGSGAPGGKTLEALSPGRTPSVSRNCLSFKK
jgi:hypothetical protein